MKEYTIADFLNKNAEAGNISFHMPGHKGRSTLFDEAGYGQLLRNAAASNVRTPVRLVKLFVSTTIPP